MPVTYGTPTTYTPPAGPPYVPANGEMEWNVTIENRPNRLLVVVFHEVFDRLVTAKCGGISMVPIHVDGYDAVFILHDPPVGVNLVSVTYTDVPGSYEAVVMALPCYVVSPTYPYRGRVAVNSGTSTTPSITVPTVAGDSVLAICITGLATTANEDDCEEIAQVTGNLYGFGRLSATVGASGSREWSQSSSGAWVTIGLSLCPVGVNGPRPLPNVVPFERLMLAYGTVLAEGSIATNAAWQASAKDEAARTAADPVTNEAYGPYSFYYDAGDVLRRIGTYRGETSPWNAGAAANLAVLHEAYYMPSFYPQAYRIFSDGAAWDVLTNGNANSRLIITGIRDTGPYSDDISSMASFNFARENSYYIRLHINAARIGAAPRQARFDQMIEWAYGHLEFVASLSWGTLSVQPFMVGLAARALITHWESVPIADRDPRLLPLLIELCDFLWEDSFDYDVLGFLYQINVNHAGEDGPRRTVGTPVLNNYMCAMYAFVALHTGDESYMLKADLAFAGCITDRSYGVDGIGSAKQFNQVHTWAFDYFRYRNEFYNPPPKRSGRIGRVV